MHTVFIPAFKVKGWNRGSFANCGLVDKSSMRFLACFCLQSKWKFRARWKIYWNSCLEMSPLSAGNAFVAGRQGGYAIAPAANCTLSLLDLFLLFNICPIFVFPQLLLLPSEITFASRSLRRRLGRRTQQLRQRLPRQPHGGGEHVQPRAAPHGAGAWRRGRGLPRQQGRRRL